MGDDLAEDWWVESEPTADESGGAAVGEDANANAGPVSEAVAPGDSDDATSPRKRKRGPGQVFDGVTGEWVAASTAAETAKVEDKKRRRRDERQKLRKTFTQKQDDILKQVADGDGCKLLNGFLSKDDDKEGTLLTEKYFVTRDPATDSAGAAIAAAFPGGVEALRAAPSKAGAPHVIVVVQSASRAVEMLRVLGAFGVGKTGKLFGKHKQLADQAAFLKSSPVCCAVGTPARLCKLVEAGALQLGRSSMLVVETTFKDAKKRTLLELHDERRDFVTLMRDGVLKACRKGKLKILLI